MAAQPKPESTAVARHDPRKALDASGHSRLAEIRAQNALVVAITNESWGQAMSPNMRRAFAEYMRRFNLDISEVDNLGGKPYRNGRYYERRIAEMRTKGLVEWTDGDMIGPDPRLQQLADAGDSWAVEENTRRLRERIRWAVPEDATHAYVTRVKLKGDQNPLEGCDWITPLRTKKTKFGEKIADPVGADEPEKTVITRSWRRVGLLAAAEIPELRNEEAAMDAGADDVAVEIEAIETHEETQHRELESRTAKRMIAAPGDIGSYDMMGGQPTEAIISRRVETPSDEQRARVRAVAAAGAAMQDPYSETSEATEESAGGGGGGTGEREPSSSGPTDSLASSQQKAKIAELLNNPELDIADEERERIAAIAGKKTFTAAAASEWIVKLERMVPSKSGLFDGEEG